MSNLPALAQSNGPAFYVGIRFTGYFRLHLLVKNVFTQPRPGTDTRDVSKLPGAIHGEGYWHVVLRVFAKRVTVFRIRV